MSKLYIFGNGLDIHYKLKTKVSNFIDILKTKAIYNESNNAADVFESYNVLWNEFESDMANIDLQMIEDNQVNFPDYLSEHEYDRDGVIENVEQYVSSLRIAVFDSLKEMIKKAEKDIEKLDNDRQWNFKKGDKILSFNYTSTIERVSNVDEIPILHIHGLYNNDDNLILGYGKQLNNYNYKKYSDADNGDNYMEKQLHIINDFYLSLKKNMQMEILEEFLRDSNTIDEVVVYGQAMGEIDAPYFELIDKIISPNIWKVSFHEVNNPVLENIKELSFYPKIIPFPW